MESILLLNPPFKKTLIRDYYCCFTSKTNYIWPPIDLLVLSGILSKYFKVKVIDAIAENLSYQSCLQKIKNENFQALVFLTGTVSFKQDFAFIKKLSQSKKFICLVSGNITLFKPKYFLKKYSFLDGIIHNFTSNDVLKFLKIKTGKVNTISYRKNKKIIIGKINFWKEKTISYPQPLHEMFPIKNYQSPIAKRLPMTSIITSFGCPFTCKFCIGSTLRYKARKIENILNELEYIKSLGIQELFFEDCTFNTNNEQIKNLCRQMIKRKFNFTWSCNIHSALVNEIVFKLMKKAGCHTVQIGIESASEKILTRYSKSTNKTLIKKAFQICKRVGLNTLGYFIIGLPGETEKSTLATIKLAKKLDPTFVSFSVATPDYGTELRKQSQEKGWLDDSEIFDSSGSAVLNTKQLSKNKANRLLKKAYLEFYLRPKIILRYLKQNLSFFGLKRIVKEGLYLIKNMVLKA